MQWLLLITVVITRFSGFAIQSVNQFFILAPSLLNICPTPVLESPLPSASRALVRRQSKIYWRRSRRRWRCSPNSWGASPSSLLSSRWATSDSQHLSHFFVLFRPFPTSACWRSWSLLGSWGLAWDSSSHSSSGIYRWGHHSHKQQTYSYNNNPKFITINLQARILKSMMSIKNIELCLIGSLQIVNINCIWCKFPFHFSTWTTLQPWHLFSQIIPIEHLLCQF